MTQYIYLISCNGYFKVGIANDVESRLAQLQTGSPYELQIEECYEFENSEIVEKAIHQAWKANRVRGEWFDKGVNKVTAVSEFQRICAALGGFVYRPESYGASPEDVEIAEEEHEYSLVGGDDWRLEARNDLSQPRYAIMRRGRNRKCIGYLGLQDMQDPYNPTKEEVVLVLSKLAEKESND